MIKAVIFDYGGVVNTDTEHAIVMDIAKSCKLSLKKAQGTVDKLKWGYEAGKITQTEYWKKFQKLSGCELPKNYRQLWKREHVRHCKDLPGTRAFARHLKKKGYLTPILSNTVIEHEKHNKKLKMYKDFNPVFLSTRIGFRKPLLGIYKHVLKKIKPKPKECVFIDDKLKNIRAARKAGMQGIVFKNLPQLKRELKKIGVEF